MKVDELCVGNELALIFQALELHAQEEHDVGRWVGVDPIDVIAIVYNVRWYPHGECPRWATQAALCGGRLGLWRHASTCDVEPRVDLINVLAE
eukprot:7831206-Pyramimonas_sp.AAC.1